MEVQAIMLEKERKNFLNHTLSFNAARSYRVKPVGEHDLKSKNVALVKIVKKQKGLILSLENKVRVLQSGNTKRMVQEECQVLKTEILKLRSEMDDFMQGQQSIFEELMKRLEPLARSFETEMIDIRVKATELKNENANLHEKILRVRTCFIEQLEPTLRMKDILVKDKTFSELMSEKRNYNNIQRDSENKSTPFLEDFQNVLNTYTKRSSSNMDKNRQNMEINTTGRNSNEYKNNTDDDPTDNEGSSEDTLRKSGLSEKKDMCQQRSISSETTTYNVTCQTFNFTTHCAVSYESGCSELSALGDQAVPD